MGRFDGRTGRLGPKGPRCNRAGPIGHVLRAARNGARRFLRVPRGLRRPGRLLGRNLGRLRRTRRNRGRGHVGRQRPHLGAQLAYKTLRLGGQAPPIAGELRDCLLYTSRCV